MARKYINLVTPHSGKHKNNAKTHVLSFAMWNFVATVCFSSFYYNWYQDFS